MLTGRRFNAHGQDSTESATRSYAHLENPLETLETIASGFEWTEGPVWLGGPTGQLLFSDVPGNAIYRWDGVATSAFLAPSGYPGFPSPDYIREGGANGLALGRGGLIYADSGNRAIVFLDLATRQRKVLVDRYQGRRLNSPNDLIVAANGDIYFTDPPLGLTLVRASPLRELKFTGVFRLTSGDRLDLIADDLSPNGIALSPDEKTLYLTETRGWSAIEIGADGQPGARRIVMSREKLGGRGDGMKVDKHGNIWTSGPGGIHVFSPAGAHLAHTPVDGRLSNCAFGADGYLYITNDHVVVRGRIREKWL